jgi:hypothetical protein
MTRDEALRLARDHQNVLSRSKFEQETERDRSLVLISGGALTVTFAFISSFMEHHPLVALPLLIAAWITWGRRVGFNPCRVHAEHRGLPGNN